MSKYIVKNCPSYLDDDQCESAFTTAVWCEDCTDCLIKRVINEVKWELNAIPDSDLAERILTEFDVEDVEE